MRNSMDKKHKILFIDNIVNKDLNTQKTTNGQNLSCSFSLYYIFAVAFKQ